MKQALKLEELAKFLLGFVGTIYFGFSWWLFPVLILTPDISMLGYLAGPKAGATTYNIFHNQALAIIIFLTGCYEAIPELQLTGIILFSHSALDRSLGYGLKYPDDFKHTHLGWIGKKNEPGISSQ